MLKLLALGPVSTSRSNTVEEVSEHNREEQGIGGQLNGRLTLARCTGETNKRATPLGSDGALDSLATRRLFHIGRKSVDFGVAYECPGVLKSHPYHSLPKSLPCTKELTRSWSMRTILFCTFEQSFGRHPSLMPN